MVAVKNSQVDTQNLSLKHNDSRLSRKFGNIYYTEDEIKVKTKQIYTTLNQIKTTGFYGSTEINMAKSKQKVILYLDLK